MARRDPDVLLPLRVIRNGINGDADNLDVAPFEFGCDASHRSELGRAYRRKILGMRKQDGPAIADPFVEPDRAVGRLGREIWSNVIDAKAHWSLLNYETQKRFGEQ